MGYIVRFWFIKLDMEEKVYFNFFFRVYIVIFSFSWFKVLVRNFFFEECLDVCVKCYLEKLMGIDKNVVVYKLIRIESVNIEVVRTWINVEMKERREGEKEGGGEREIDIRSSEWGKVFWVKCESDRFLFVFWGREV